MPAPKNNSLKYAVNFEPVANVIGAIEAADEVSRSDRYIGALITFAHSKASDEFDLQIAADAMATSGLKHMFEWGTVGINSGKTTRKMNPMNPDSHLWKHKLTGSGKTKAIGFDFMPSKVPVPLPTTEKTGISQKYLSKLKGKHIFWNKAFVMESGTPVKIYPKKASKLFIPLMGSPSAAVRPQDVARGFIMTKGPVTTVPGARSAGTFTAYWERFWNGKGEEIMKEEMQKTFNNDLESVVRRAGRTKGSIKPPSITEFKAEKKKGQAAAQRYMRQRLEERNGMSNGR